ncbi:cell division protein SepF [bacterium]|nr:cell division protein SepF [bacterium]
MAFVEKVTDLMGSLIRTVTGDDIYESDPVRVFDDEYIVEDNTVRKPDYSTRTRNEDRKVVTSLNNYKGHEVKIIEPRSFGDVKQISQLLLDNRTVVLNLHLLDKEQSQRTIDFVCGASFALGGTQQKVGDTVFVFTPQSVQLSVESKESALAESLWAGNL